MVFVMNRQNLIWSKYNLATVVILSTRYAMCGKIESLKRDYSIKLIKEISSKRKQTITIISLDKREWW